MEVAEEKTDFIKSWYGKNFMSLKEAKFEFDEHGNVISLVGYNDSGKSAGLKLLAVVLYDAFANEQVNYIHDDEDHFTAGVIFESGVEIRKHKMLNGKSLWEMEKDGVLVYSNRTPAGVITAMPTVPDVIAKYLNVAFDDVTKEYLNYRDADSKLIMVSTSGGDNYKMLNAFLRHDVLAESSLRVSKRVNEINNERVSATYRYNTLKGEADRLTFIPEDKLSNFKGLLGTVKDSRLRLSTLVDLKDKKSLLDSIVVYPELQTVDTTVLEGLQNIDSILRTLQEPIYSEVELIDVNLLNDMYALKSITDQFREVPSFELSGVSTEVLEGLYALREVCTAMRENMVFNELSLVKEDKLIDLSALRTLLSQITDIDNRLSEVNNTLSSVQHELKHLSDEHGFRTCEVCGTVSV